MYKSSVHEAQGFVSNREVAVDTLVQVSTTHPLEPQILLIEQKRLRLLQEKGFKGAKRAQKRREGVQRAALLPYVEGFG
jgi:hypothetical protein